MKNFLSFALAFIMLLSGFSVSSFVSLAEELEKPTTEKIEASEEVNNEEAQTIDQEPIVIEEESVSIENPVRESNTVTGEIATASGKCGANVQWILDDVGTLTIYGTGSMSGFDYNYWDKYSTYYPAGWYDYRASIKKVIIKEGVTSIGINAFHECSAIEIIDIADSVTIIGAGAFDYCSSLKEINIGIGVNKIYGQAFYKCNALDKINIRSLETWCNINFSASYIDGDYINYGNPLNLTKKLYLNGQLIQNLVIPESVTSISAYAFEGCTSLKSITVHDKVENIDEKAFNKCTGLTKVNITDIAAWCMLNFYDAYSNPLYYAKNLYLNGNLVKDISLPDITTYINSFAFYNCTSLKSVSIPSTITTIGKSAFCYCTNLSNIYIADAEMQLREYAFAYTPIKNVVIPDTVTNIATNVFRGCSNLESITIPFVGESRKTENDSYQYPFGYIFGTSSYNGGVATSQSYPGSSSHSISTTTYYIPSTLVNVTVTDSNILYGAFNNCENIKSVTLPEDITKIGERAFKGCTALSEIFMPDSIREIDGSAFYNCTSLTDVILPINLEAISYNLFYGCSKLKSVTVGNNVKEIRSYSFENCYSLSKINVPDQVITIESHAFNGCSSLSNIVLPDSVKNIGIDVFDGSGYYCNSSNWINDVLYVGNHLIKAKTTITGIYNIKQGTKSIAASAFKGCFYLTSVTIPDSVISIGTNVFNGTALYDDAENWVDGVLYIDNCIIKTQDSVPNEYVINDKTRLIADYAFSYCYALTELTIPESVEYIGNNVFYQCDVLKIKCNKNSVAEAYALANSIPVSYIHTKCVFTNYISNNDGNCYEDGTMTAYCDLGCGKTDTITEPDSKIHDYYLDIVRSATCQRDGLGVNICDICRAYYTEIIPKVDHKFGTYIYNEDATCYADGTRTAKCTYGCGTTDTIPEEGSAAHRYSNYVYNEDATCLKNGTKTAYCDFGCGNIKTITASNTKLPHDYKKEIIEPPTCISEGVMICICKGCLNYTYEDIPVSSEHSGEWKVTVEPTVYSEGEKTRVCELCGVTEIQTIVKIDIPVLDADNYTVSVTSADYIKYIRYAYGQYNSSAEIKNASDCVTLNQRSVSAYINDGTAKLEMPKGGYYSFWIKLTDGSEYIYIADLSVMVQSVSVATNNVTVHNLYGVKDFFIAYGEQDSYRAVKDNLLVQVTNKKIGETHDYSYLINKSGRYTLCVRYEDATREYSFITFEVILPEVVFAGNGAKLNVSGIDDVKVIRYAYGEYNSVAQIKRAEGNVSYTGKGRLKDLNEYTLEFSKEGPVSVAVVFNNGYTVLYKYVF